MDRARNASRRHQSVTPRRLLHESAQHKIGAFTPRVVHSRGDYDNPGGNQSLFLAGGTVELTQTITLYLEYVNWDVKADGGSKTKYEDGWPFVIAWHL